MNYKFCPECGQKLPINATFCTNCGTKQPVDGKQAADSQASMPQAKQSASQPSSATVTPSSSQVDAHMGTETEDRRFSRQHSASQPASQPSPSTNLNEEKATVKQPQSEAGDQPQFFNPQSRRQAYREREREQVNEEPQQQESFNPRPDHQSTYQQNDGSQSGQQESAYAYNESGQPGLSSSFSIWLNCLSKSNACMGRADYWWGYLAFWLIEMLISFCIRSLLVIIPDNAPILLILSLIVYVVCAVFQIFATVERLHDTGHSGWNYLWVFTGIGAFYVLYLIVQPTNWNEQRWVRQ